MRRGYLAERRPKLEQRPRSDPAVPPPLSVQLDVGCRALHLSVGGCAAAVPGSFSQHCDCKVRVWFVPFASRVVRHNAGATNFDLSLHPGNAKWEGGREGGRESERDGTHGCFFGSAVRIQWTREGRRRYRHLGKRHFWQWLAVLWHI